MVGVPRIISPQKSNLAPLVPIGISCACPPMTGVNQSRKFAAIHLRRTSFFDNGTVRTPRPRPTHLHTQCMKRKTLFFRFHTWKYNEPSGNENASLTNLLPDFVFYGGLSLHSVQREHSPAILPGENRVHASDRRIFKMPHRPGGVCNDYLS